MGFIVYSIVIIKYKFSMINYCNAIVEIHGHLFVVKKSYISIAVKI